MDELSRRRWRRQSEQGLKQTYAMYRKQPSRQTRFDHLLKWIEAQIAYRVDRHE